MYCATVYFCTLAHYKGPFIIIIIIIIVVVVVVKNYLNQAGTSMHTSQVLKTTSAFT